MTLYREELHEDFVFYAGVFEDNPFSLQILYQANLYKTLYQEMNQVEKLQQDRNLRYRRNSLSN